MTRGRSRRLPSATTTSIRQSLSLGSTYRYVVKATDGAGNRSSWAYGPDIDALVAQQSSRAATFRGPWTTRYSSGYSGGSTRFATAAGATASYTFTGSGVGWVTATGPTRGSARVYIDGAYTTTVRLYASTTGLRRIAYAANWTSQGTTRSRSS